MNREDFLKALAANEDDVNLRLVFADWLDDQGEHEEASRERGWLAAKEWLARFARKHSTEFDKYAYSDLLDFGRRATAAEEDGKVYFSERMWSALKTNIDEFWTNWSLVTGLPSPTIPEDRGFQHWVCCSHEVYYWFGLPDPEDADE
jgi:uncharacterized protein (TIGR02996 family)